MAKKSRRSFKLIFKVKIIKYYEKVRSKAKTAAKFNIDRKSVRRWLNERVKIFDSLFKRSRSYIHRNCSSHFPELERILNNFVIEQRSRGVCVTSREIKREALRIANNLNIINFTASNGWFENFLKRFNFTLRRISSTGRQLPTNIKEIIQDHLKTCADDMAGRDRSEVFNFDETCVYLDNPSK